MLTRPARRVALAAATVLSLAAAVLPGPAAAQPRKDTATLAMALEPPGLDPTAGAASAIAEVVLYNVFETLTKINGDGRVTPLLAESWTISENQKTYTFKLRRNVKFQNGEPFTSANVKFSWERAAADTSTNKDKANFSNIAKIETPDPLTAVVTLKQENSDFLFLMAQATAIMVDPKSAAANATQPVGTGPYKLDSWVKGSSLVLGKWDGFRDAATIKLSKVTMRFISDPAAQVASLLSGDVDAFPRVAAARALGQFKSDPRFQVLIGTSRAKTIVAMNNKKKPLDDVRVRRAISAAIDRNVVIQGAADGFGEPIGSHYVRGMPGYVDTTGINPYNVEKAKALLKEAGVTTPLELSLKLPPPAYARQGGEVVAALLAKVGIVAKIENVEWAQWLSGVYTNKNYDLTIIAHVEPIDLFNYAKTNYYWNYESPAFRDLYDRIQATPVPNQRERLLADAQRMIANDAVNVFLYQPQLITVASSKLKGLWKDVPIFANDLSTLEWTQ